VAEPDRSSDSTPARPKTPAELEAEIAVTRDRLAATIAELRVQTAPANLAKRGVNTVKGFFTDEFGGVRPDRVAIVAGAVIGLVVLRRLRRGRRSA
jgi:hypothetical protein